MAYQLILDKAGDGASQYVGKAEKCLFTFETIPEQIPGEQWLANKIINGHIEELGKQHSRLLHIRVWRDTAPTWRTNYQVEVYASASPLFWTVIIVGVLALIAAFMTWKILEEVKDIDWSGVSEPMRWGTVGLVIVAGVVLFGMLASRRT